MKSFPKELFVRQEEDPSDSEIRWFSADAEMESGVNVGETTTVAVYKLIEVRKVTGTIVYKTRKVKNAA